MQLPKVRPLFRQARFSTPSTNSDVIYLAGADLESQSASLRFAIAAGKEFPLPISDLSLIYVYGTADDVLDVICEIQDGNTMNMHTKQEE